MQSRPIIFLDFDGVLNSVRSVLALGGCGEHQFDEVAVNLVARLAGTTNAKVVISSAWRIGRDVQGLRAILGRYSTTLAARVIDRTPSLNACRGAEIAHWLAENKNEHDGSYVIVDDDSDMLDGQLPRFVQTSQCDGFGVPEYLKALEIIAPGHADVSQLAHYTTQRREPHAAPMA